MDDTTKVIALLALGYFAFVHQGGFFKNIGATAASPAPPPQMPRSDAQAVADTVTTGLNVIRDIFAGAQQSTASRASGVANV